MDADATKRRDPADRSSMVKKQRGRPRPSPSLNSRPPSKRQTGDATCMPLKLEHGVESPCPVRLPLSVGPPPNAFDHTAIPSPVKPTSWTPPSPAPSDTFSESSQSQGVRPRTPAFDAMIERLMWPRLEEKVDRYFLKDEIIPRIAMCSTSDLVHSVFEIEPTQFHEQARKALARPGRSSLRTLFEHDCRRPTDQTKADWVLPLAEFATGGHGRQHNLMLAHAQRRARLTTEAPYDTDDQVEQHHFMTCCEHMASANGGSATRGMLVPLGFGVCPPYDLAYLAPFPLVNVVLDLARDVLTQPARLYAPGLAIVDTEAYLVVLDHEAYRIGVISDCWGQGFGELASVLSILLGLDVYSAGLSPLFRYACHPETGIVPVAFFTTYLRPPELEAGAPLVGRTVEFVDEEPVELVDSAVASGSSVFGRCTVVFQLTRPSLLPEPAASPDYQEPSFVLKIQHMTPNFVGNEAKVLSMIVDRCASAASELSFPIVSHVALPEITKSFCLHRSQMDERDLPVLMDSGAPEQRLRDSSRRTVDLLILRNPTPLPTRVDTGRRRHHTLLWSFKVFDQLLTLLPALFDLGIHHRDLSLGNILHYQGHLVLVDWDTGIVAPPGERVPIAAEDDGSIRFTRATASYQAHTWVMLGKVPRKLPSHALHHDFESAVYWFLLVLGYFIGDMVSTEVWTDLQLRSSGNDTRVCPVFPMDLARLELWGDGEYPKVREEFLEGLGKVDTELHDLVMLMTCTLPIELAPPTASTTALVVATKQKMATVQAELRRILARVGLAMGVSLVVLYGAEIAWTLFFACGCILSSHST
ncbi:BQ2448_3801 [Microbotryum intermedium]|uniref:BQ2448_3801 protein n=1 Tax=Microbotryum intermedium TaxID=269621 RepID=A0A238FE19_9BASI|nr:BQ2448_3801 [Microbotryum intermedium]